MGCFLSPVVVRPQLVLAYRWVGLTLRLTGVRAGRDYSVQVVTQGLSPWSGSHISRGMVPASLPFACVICGVSCGSFGTYFYVSSFSLILCVGF